MSKTDFPILRREDADPAAFAKAAWGGVFNHRRATERVPRAVVSATSTAHVAEAVKLAVREGCRVSVRSGGHSWAGWSVREDAVLIDLGGLPGGKYWEPMVLEDGAVASKPNDDGLDYDPRTKIASCPPSCTGRKLTEFLGREGRGRMFCGGHCPDVGLGGFLLQGGMGWNCKNWGWACESIVGIDVVTADGKEMYCSQVENADLLWAARGAGPGFPAIVTRFYLLTRPRQEMYQSLYLFPISEYRTVLQWVIDISATADPDTEMVAVALYPPDDEEMSVLANFTSFKSSRDEAESALRPLHESRPAKAKLEIFCQDTSFAQEYAAQAASNPEGHRYCSENAYVGNEEDVPAVLEQAFTTLPNRKSCALYFAMNPTSRRPHYTDNAGDTGMALSMQTDHYFALYTVWTDKEDDQQCCAWVHGIMKEVEKHAAGSYLGDSDFQHRRTKFWADDNAKRLMEIRRKWDPKARICGYLGGEESVMKNEFEWKRA